MRDVVLEEIKKELNWKEKVVVSVFKKVFIKMYRKGMVDCFNYYNK